MKGDWEWELRKQSDGLPDFFVDFAAPTFRMRRGMDRVKGFLARLLRLNEN